MSISLPTLQKNFLSHIRAKQAPNTGLWAGNIAPGLRIYRNAYRVRLHDCLCDIYEKTRLWIGDEAFDDVTAAYIDSHPPTSWTLDAYGDHVPQFLHEQFPDDTEIGDIAWLERAMRESFTAADPIALTVSDFASRTANYSEDDWGDMRLILQPNLYHHSCRSNCATIWNALEREETPPAATIIAEYQLIVWRQGLVPCFQSFSQEESTALHNMRGGLNFGALCHMLADTGTGHTEEATMRVGGYLAHWIEAGLVVDIASKATPQT